MLKMWKIPRQIKINFLISTNYFADKMPDSRIFIYIYKKKGDSNFSRAEIDVFKALIFCDLQSKPRHVQVTVQQSLIFRGAFGISA